MVKVMEDTVAVIAHKNVKSKLESSSLRQEIHSVHSKIFDLFV